MTLVTISHLAAAAVHHHHPHQHLHGCSNEPDRFSLNSNLSGSSPQSSLTSPFSTSADFTTGSPASFGSCSCRSDHSDDGIVSAAHKNSICEVHTTTNTTNFNNEPRLHSAPIACANLNVPTYQQHHNHNHHHNHQNNNQSQSEDHHHQQHLNERTKEQQIQHNNNNNNNDHHHQKNEQQSALSLSPRNELCHTKVRRPSRSEHRQSLSDLGYGKIESYVKLQRLGKGTYATVYMGRSRLSNDLVALKEILKEHDEGAPCTAIREVSLLRLLRHNNIVTLHDICHTPKKLTLVFEYVGPDLYAYMKENNHLLSIHNVRLLLYQLLRGISFCHSRQVLHRDLKPQNLLINSKGELKICDFGLARAKSIPTKSYSNEVVTLWYRPPDVLLGNTDYNDSIDMWGVGCIFFEMASGRTFFPGTSVRQQLYLIFSCLGAPNKYNWPEMISNPEYLSYNFPPFRQEKLIHRAPRLDLEGMSLLMKFLRYRPSERITAEQARKDPFFSTLPSQVHHLNERESIFDIAGIYMSLNPGQKLNHHM